MCSIKTYCILLIQKHSLNIYIQVILVFANDFDRVDFEIRLRPKAIQTVYIIDIYVIVSDIIYTLQRCYVNLDFRHNATVVTIGNY